MKKVLNFKSTVFGVNILVICAIMVLNYFYQRNGFDFTLKCVYSGGFALLGLVNLLYAFLTKQANMPFYLGMASGLMLAMMGDVIIKYSFIFGAAVFALGHIGFIFAYSFLRRITKLDLVISGILFVGSAAFLLFCPILVFEIPAFRFVCIAYALVICFMLGKAIGNLISEKSTVNIIIVIASILFFFSDLMLVLDWFIGLWEWTSEACMGTYYPALCLLAFSMLLHNRESTAK